MAFIQGNLKNEEFALSEWVLIETYNLVRNGAVIPKPMSAKDAVAFIQSLRGNRHWSLSKGTEDVSEQIWKAAMAPDFSRRAIFDARIAFSLAAYGVKRFATRNVSDFERFGLFQVFDPTISSA